jgi:hypothetical protein
LNIITKLPAGSARLKVSGETTLIADSTFRLQLSITGISFLGVPYKN